MKAYKGFDKNLQCKGFQYEIGKEFKTDKADLCNSGFHACEFPMDVFSYYAPGESRFCEVDLLQETDQKKNDSKRCGRKIKIGAEIGIKGIIDASVKFIFENAKESFTKNKKENAATQGDWAHAATQGNEAHAATQGYKAHAATQGNEAHAEVKGKNSIACSLGRFGAAKGALGCWIALAEYDDDGNVIGGKFAQVDGEKIKPDIYYCLKNGEFMEERR